MSIFSFIKEAGEKVIDLLTPGKANASEELKKHVEKVGLGNPNITELASEMQITKPTVTVGIDKLIERDYVYKVQSDDDRRNSHLHLTDKGRQINDMHIYAHERFSELIKETLEPHEIDTLVQILEKLTVKL